MNGDLVPLGVRDYGAFRKVLRGFQEVGNRNCELFVGLDVGNSVRGLGFAVGSRLSVRGTRVPPRLT